MDAPKNSKTSTLNYSSLDYNLLQVEPSHNNFYTPWHAHSICDGHAATVKSVIRREEIATNNVPVEPSDFVAIDFS
jgi:hypothetical protein